MVLTASFDNISVCLESWNTFVIITCWTVCLSRWILSQMQVKLVYHSCGRFFDVILGKKVCWIFNFLMNWGFCIIRRFFVIDSLYFVVAGFEEKFPQWSQFWNSIQCIPSGSYRGKFEKKPVVGVNATSENILSS